MNRVQEKQFIAEHVCSWRLVFSSWLALAAIAISILLVAWSPLKACDALAYEARQIDWQWPQTAQRLQHRSDDPDEFFDPSEP
ncbi:MAG: hypothetical protein JXQ99_21260 [Hyphomicrobiaceae bacterium]